MTTKFTYQTLNIERKIKYVLLFFVSIFIVVNIGVDFFTAKSQNYSFYFSEALIFSSYWLLFVPLVQLFLKFVKRTYGFVKHFMIFTIVVLIHSLTYPFLVWLFSKIYYYHTFEYFQTFRFGLSAYLIKTLIIYAFILLSYSIFKIQRNFNNFNSEKNIEPEIQNYISSIIVLDNTRKVIINVEDIFYFSANSPYVNIFHNQKKYLHSETLKSLEKKLNAQLFVRIHKSHIVNVTKISSLQSRKNGDYDITLSDSTSLRVSRNYAKKFKEIFEHHLAIK